MSVRSEDVLKTKLERCVLDTSVKMLSGRCLARFLDQNLGIKHFILNAYLCTKKCRVKTEI